MPIFPTKGDTGPAGAPEGTLVVKSADQTKNNDAVLGADSELKITVAASKAYWFEMYISFYADAAPDFKWGLDGVAVSAIGFVGTCKNSGTTYSNISDTALAGSYSLTATSTGIGFVRIAGHIISSGAGDINFMWAQNSSHANDVKVLAGSWIRYGSM